MITTAKATNGHIATAKGLRVKPAMTAVPATSKLTPAMTAGPAMSKLTPAMTAGPATSKLTPAMTAGVIALCSLFFASCDESDAVIRGKLDVVLADDLAAIVDSVAAAALIDKPYFELVSYKEYDEGAYSRMAVADFFFLKPLAGVTKKIGRKYRYHRRLGMWDRYHNKYYTVMPDSAGAGGGGGD